MYKNIIRLIIITAVLLMIPAIGMQVSTEWNWTLSDFVFAGVLIFGTGLAYTVIAQKAGTLAYRAATGLALGAAFLLVWINLAVGIIGNEDNPLNLMYFAVIVIAIIGAVIARLQANKMSTAMFVTAIAQFLVPFIALIVSGQAISTNNEAIMGVVAVFVLSTIFAAMFGASGFLYRKSVVNQ